MCCGIEFLTLDQAKKIISHIWQEKMQDFLLQNFANLSRLQVFYFFSCLLLIDFLPSSLAFVLCHGKVSETSRGGKEEGGGKENGFIVGGRSGLNQDICTI